MRTVIQRVSEASVTIDGSVHGAIGRGYMILVGIADSDDEAVINKMADKIARLRIFEDENGKMNLNLEQVSGAILSISQFTLYADCRKGNRPSFSKAGRPDHAKKMYLYFNDVMRRYGFDVQEGIFGADMKVRLLNDGPVTIVLDSDTL
ncbi:D-aminoacyl-tRNA deacylase [Stecheria sp. CLA-KB-P133]|uniref:D-aminoacyl-tRNA deacylase n=1 Tax=Grylomicrobium aquisgranensis TaxID=2926318 RepID=A0AB35U479_9FIRM|nr:D-aminoacyl-tRNA deacylase [Lactimicrobium massiliense]MDX8419650.1 D-aminoacyl-tRNA deacylase [Stecheria sp. CLA-KB-P133]MDD6230804.1 D-aminoacyl-tRNA deacylase [Lactimicrobium massiliense]MDD6457960.1 D-aminoacyl-tRNA deacylase [Lactimicrobium massiliense]MDD6559590.1 D-aminoacyl-tRNA deacylase [Lactimicrobium massiliense]MDD6674708.1 D-aminoacyl-tRNA deacylase [Lactimicrobium massiliense]